MSSPRDQRVGSVSFSPDCSSSNEVSSPKERDPAVGNSVSFLRTPASRSSCSPSSGTLSAVHSAPTGAPHSPSVTSPATPASPQQNETPKRSTGKLQLYGYVDVMLVWGKSPSPCEMSCVVGQGNGQFFTSSLGKAANRWEWNESCTFIVTNIDEPFHLQLHSTDFLGNANLIGVAELKWLDLVDEQFHMLELPVFNRQSEKKKGELCIQIQFSRSSNAGFLAHYGDPVPDIPQRLQTGDIILFDTKKMSAKVTSVLTQSRWDHVAMIVTDKKGDVLLLEALLDTGVSLNPLKHVTNVIAAGGSVGVRHLMVDRGSKGALMKSKLREHLKSVLGRPYEQHVGAFVRAGLGRSKNLTEEENRSLFCSQLIAATYMEMEVLSAAKSAGDYLPKDFGKNLDLKEAVLQKVLCFRKPQPWVLSAARLDEPLTEKKEKRKSKTSSMRMKSFRRKQTLDFSRSSRTDLTDSPAELSTTDLFASEVSGLREELTGSATQSPSIESGLGDSSKTVEEPPEKSPPQEEEEEENTISFSLSSEAIGSKPLGYEAPRASGSADTLKDLAEGPVTPKRSNTDSQALNPVSQPLTLDSLKPAGSTQLPPPASSSSLVYADPFGMYADPFAEMGGTGVSLSNFLSDEEAPSPVIKTVSPGSSARSNRSGTQTNLSPQTSDTGSEKPSPSHSSSRVKSPLPFFQKFKTSTELGSKSPKSPKSPGVRLKSPLKSRNTKSPDTDFELDLGEGRRTKEEGRRRETQPSFVDFLKKSTKKRERRRLVQSSQVVSGVSQELKAPYGPYSIDDEDPSMYIMGIDLNQKTVDLSGDDSISETEMYITGINPKMKTDPLRRPSRTSRDLVSDDESEMYIMGITMNAAKRRQKRRSRKNSSAGSRSQDEFTNKSEDTSFTTCSSTPQTPKKAKEDICRHPASERAVSSGDEEDDDDGSNESSEMYIMRVDPDQPLFGPPTIRRSQQLDPSKLKDDSEVPIMVSEGPSDETEMYIMKVLRNEDDFGNGAANRELPRVGKRNVPPLFTEDESSHEVFLDSKPGSGTSRTEDDELFIVGVETPKGLDPFPATLYTKGPLPTEPGPSPPSDEEYSYFILEVDPAMKTSARASGIDKERELLERERERKRGSDEEETEMYIMGIPTDEKAHLYRTETQKEMGVESFQERGSDEETEMYIMGIDSEIAMKMKKKEKEKGDSSSRSKSFLPKKKINIKKPNTEKTTRKKTTTPKKSSYDGEGSFSLSPRQGSFSPWSSKKERESLSPSSNREPLSLSPFSSKRQSLSPSSSSQQRESLSPSSHSAKRHSLSPSPSPSSQQRESLSPTSTVGSFVLSLALSLAPSGERESLQGEEKEKKKEKEKGKIKESSSFSHENHYNSDSKGESGRIERGNARRKDELRKERGVLGKSGSCYSLRELKEEGKKRGEEREEKEERGQRDERSPEIAVSPSGRREGEKRESEEGGLKEEMKREKEREKEEESEEEEI